MNPLNNQDFLFNLYQQKNHEVYAKIISLSFDERPIEQIEGKVLSGSVNLDAFSAVRRTCNLSLLASDVKINNYNWGISNKFKLEIGLKNNIDSNYPEIIWFKQGLFVITSFNSTLNTNGHNISINGKDKMCLLNGDISGNLPASVDFGQLETTNYSYTKIEFEDKKNYEAAKYYIFDGTNYVLSFEKYDANKTYYTRDNLLARENIPIKNIIREAVRVYGKEEYHNIVINDLDEFGLELMEYRGNKDLYLLYDEDAGIYTNITYDGSIDVGNGYKLETIPDNQYNTAVNKLDNKNKYKFSWTTQNNITKTYSVTRLKSGDVAGYRTTDLTYTGELISSIGESLTSILDKIKNMLGAFEYFYDLDGRFVFQAAKTYQNKSWNTLQKIDGDVFARDAVEDSPYEFSFDDSNLITAFQNSAVINEIKNDYSVHGNRKGVTGMDIPIHARYAISKKPQFYKSYDGKTIYIGDKEILDDFKQSLSEEIKISLLDEVLKFEPAYLSSLPSYLTPPTRLPDGSWTPGWWDIRDWYEYYRLIKKEDPKYSMKAYSKNSAEGCIPVKDFKDDYYSNAYAWLIIVPPNSSYINLQHGSGDPRNLGSWHILYQSEYDENGNLQTFYLDNNGQKKFYGGIPSAYYNTKTEEARAAIAKYLNTSIETIEWFIPPYSGCSDNHTYLEFLEGDIKRDGNNVYFYNPNFPGTNSFDEVIKEQVDKTYNDKLLNGEIQIVDWRELIYQMAIDYYKNNQKPAFLTTIINNNKKPDGLDSYYPTGKTGYEIFYSDMQAFWRQLYNPNPEKIYDYTGGKYVDERIYAADGVTYTIETKWQDYEKKEDSFTCNYYLDGPPDEKGNYSTEKKYWHKNIDQAPELLNFWIDFFDNQDSLGQYSIQAIGDRPKVVNNSKITSIYFRNVPQVILCRPEDYKDLNIKTGYTYVHISNALGDLFTISARGKSAEEEINELFYKHSCCAENITITSIPVYHLEPNTLIYVHNKESNISGKFRVDRISLPLNYNGTMSITASKVIDPIY